VPAGREGESPSSPSHKPNTKGARDPSLRDPGQAPIMTGGASPHSRRGPESSGPHE